MWTSLKSWIDDLSPACKQASEWQSRALDAPLPLRKRAGLWIHLRLCRWCRRYGQQIGLLRQVCRKCDEEPASPPKAGLSDEAKERMKQRLQSRRD
jgi:hypothetical protein